MPYPAAPGERMAYDRDGSIIVGWDAGVTGIIQASTGTMQQLNTEHGGGAGWYLSNIGGYGSPIAYRVTIFPELRDVVGIMWGVQGGDGPLDFATSPDTTTGQDGTWTTQTFPNPGANMGGANSPDYRSSISSVNWLGIRAIRMHGLNGGQPYGLPFYWYYWHLYGKPSLGQNPDSLRIWQPSADAEVTGPSDFGNVQQGSVYVQSFRVKNLSGTYTAVAPITIGMANILSDSSPSLIPQFEWSINGGVSYSQAVQLTSSLPPGGTTPVIYVRNSVVSNAELGLAAGRFLAVAADWK